MNCLEQGMVCGRNSYLGCKWWKIIKKLGARTKRSEKSGRSFVEEAV